MAIMKRRFKSQSGAERRVRELERQIIERDDVIARFCKELSLLSRLAAKGPAFDNPLVAFEAEHVRDEYLRRMGMGPDGKFLPKETT